MTKEHHCPTCKALLTRKYPRRMIFVCPNGHGPFRAVLKRKAHSSFDPNDSSTWHARCAECGGRMDYYNFKYGCDNCGNVLHV